MPQYGTGSARLGEIKEYLEDLIGNDDIESALQELNEILLKNSPRRNEVISLMGRLSKLYKEYYIKGVLFDEQLRIEYNRIQVSLIRLIGLLNINDFDPNFQKEEKERKGYLLYRIPTTMQLEEKSHCIIRVALNLDTIRENIELDSYTIEKETRVSKTMKIELVDPSHNQLFTIRIINEPIQFIEYDEYTEWIFDVTPLQEGIFSLLLKVSIIKIVEGQHYLREKVLEEKIEVVALPVKDSAETLFRSTGVMFEFSTTASKNTSINWITPRLTERFKVVDLNAWNEANAKDTLSSYLEYMNQFPRGEYVKYAQEKIKKLEADRVSKLEQTNSKKDEKLPIISPDGIFTDPRDGQQYKTMEFNGKLWLVENLNYEEKNSWHYKDNLESAKKYGRLYTWEAAKKACPSGWRLPTNDEWVELAMQFGGYYDYEIRKVFGNPQKAYNSLIENGDSGFNAFLGGYRHPNGIHIGLGNSGFYWSGTENDIESAWIYNFNFDNKELLRATDRKPFGFSCRCIIVRSI